MMHHVFAQHVECAGDERLPDWFAAPAPEWFHEAVETPSEAHWIEVHGCPIAVREWGVRGRPAVMLVHGFAAHSHWWDCVAPLLAGRLHVGAVDLSGMGDSGHRRAYSLDLHVAEVLAACDALGFADETALVGHSYGGYVVCRAAAERPGRFARLVMVDSPLSPPGGPPLRRREVFDHPRHNVYPTLARALARFRVVPEQPCEHPYVLAHIAGHSLKEVAGGFVWKFDDRVLDLGEVTGLEHDYRLLADRITFVYGARSSVVTEAHRRYMHELAGGRVPFIAVDDAAHHLFLNQPLAFAETLARVLHAHE